MASNPAVAAPTGPRVPPPRPYRDFLTPSLHRRFTSAALVGLSVCWVEAILMSEPGLFWSWFPLGFTGARTLLLFVSSLSVFILRVAQLHLGQRTTTSGFQTFWQHALSRNTIQTLFWYTTSSFLFSEVYIFSMPKSANLAWIDPGRSYERPRLNERPVFFRSLFLILAVVQSVFHLYFDYDLVSLSQTGGAQPLAGKEGFSWESLLARLLTATKVVAQRSVLLVSTTLPVALVTYHFLGLQSVAWSVALKVGRSLFTVSKQATPPGLTIVGGTLLMIRFVWSALLLSIIWQVSNYVFTIYTAQEPLKKGNPLTTDSKDPNGSLIAGLKAKKDIPLTIAFWELNTITAKFPERRATLYLDLERKGGSTWSQIKDACLSEIQSVSQRIQDTLPAASEKVSQEKSTAQQVRTLPRIGQPLKNENIFNPSPPATDTLKVIQGGVSNLAKSYGSTPGQAQAQKLLEFNVLSDDMRQQISNANLVGRRDGYIAQFLRSPLGVPFRSTFSRQINAIVFGAPHSNASRIINAVQSICGLVVHSLKEDRIGSVQKDIATIVCTLVATIQSVQNLVQTLPPSSTDVDFNGTRRVKEVDELLDVLRSGLGEILMTFGEYASNLGIKRAEMQVAREIAAGGSQMAMKAR